MKGAEWNHLVTSRIDQFFVQGEAEEKVATEKTNTSPSMNLLVRATVFTHSGFLQRLAWVTTRLQRSSVMGYGAFPSLRAIDVYFHSELSYEQIFWI